VHLCQSSMEAAPQSERQATVGWYSGPSTCATAAARASCCQSPTPCTRGEWPCRGLSAPMPAPRPYSFTCVGPALQGLLTEAARALMLKKTRMQPQGGGAGGPARGSAGGHRGRSRRGPRRRSDSWRTAEAPPPPSPPLAGHLWTHRQAPDDHRVLLQRLHRRVMWRIGVWHPNSGSGALM
jgi:hypothetical protein